MTNEEKIAYFITICVFFVILVAIGSLAIITAHQCNVCNSSPIPYCYKDWKCLDPNDTTKEIEMSQNTLYGDSGVIKGCGLLTDETLKEFKYTTYDGKEIIAHPITEANLWDTRSGACIKEITDNCPNKYDISYPECISKHSDKCPRYEKGGIYWGSCNGNETSQYYTKPEIYNALQQKSSVLYSSMVSRNFF